MRRALHSFIIALLCLTLGIDSAKACWFWRHRCRPTVARHAVCPPAGTCGIPCAETHGTAVPHGATGTAACCQALPVDVVVVSAGDSAVAADACDCTAACGTTEPAHAAVIVDEGPATETTVAVQAAEPGNVVVHEPTVVVDAAPAPTTAAAPAAQDLLPVPQPAPTPPSVVTQASGARPAEPPVPANDDTPLDKPVDKPVEPLVMPTTPEPAPEPAAPAPEASLAVAPPARPNLFDLYDDADDSAAAHAGRRDSGDAQVPPTAPPAPAAADAAEDAAPAPEPAMKKEAPAAETDKPATEPEQPAAEPAPTPPEEPAAEDTAAEPAVEATARSVPNEPQRLWTDASGSHRARGWLVTVDVEHVRILKANGRHTTVAIAALSAADRDYVADVTARLAAARTVAPGSGETAGL